MRVAGLFFNGQKCDISMAIDIQEAQGGIRTTRRATPGTLSVWDATPLILSCTRDALVLRDVAPSTGFSSGFGILGGKQWVNAGEIENKGVEVLVS